MIHSYFGALFSVLGYITAATIAYFIYKAVKRRRKLPVWAWRKYLRHLLREERFEEAQIIKTLVKGKTGNQLAKVPKGYVVTKKPEIDLEDRFDNMTFVVKSSYEIRLKDKDKEIIFVAKE